MSKSSSRSAARQVFYQEGSGHEPIEPETEVTVINPAGTKKAR